MKQFLSMLWQTAFFFSILRITAPILFAADSSETKTAKDVHLNHPFFLIEYFQSEIFIFQSPYSFSIYIIAQIYDKFQYNF